MVDLVKIRKKAKEKRAKELAEAAKAPAAAAESGNAVSADGDAEAGAAHDSAAGLETAPDMSQVTTADALARLEAFKERVGRGGDDDAAAGDAAQPSEVQLELLTFLVADETYAIDIEQIVEIVPPRKPTRVPNAQPGVLGIISLRGTIVTVVDVASRLSHAGRPVTPASRMIVVARNGETAAFTVDQVLRVVAFSPHALDFVPAVAGTEHHDYIMGVFRQESDLTILLDIDKVLSA